MAIGKWTGFGTWKLIVDGQMYYFQSIEEVKHWFKELVKKIAIKNIKATLPVLLNYIPTESGQLAEAIYAGSVYGVMAWKDKIIIQTRIYDPQLYPYQKKSKVAHWTSEHRANRAPAMMPNHHVNLVTSSGDNFTYLRDDPLATKNYMALIRRYMKDAAAATRNEIMGKSYFVHIHVKVSKNAYGKEAYLNPRENQLARKVNILAMAPTTNPIDEFGTLIALYNQP